MRARARARGAAAVALLCCGSLLAACSSPNAPTQSVGASASSSPSRASSGAGAPLAMPAPSVTAATPAKGEAGSAAPGRSGGVTLTAKQARQNPSGVVMPKGDLPGWKQVIAEGFNGSSLDDGWVAYSGTPGGDPDGWWDPSHATTSKGVLKLRTTKKNGKWVSAGVGSWNRAGLKYGKVDVRFRVPKGNGIAYAFLLWPSGGGWPPEIDFAEDGGGARTSTSATLHYGSANHQIARSVTADFTQWHTVGVEWTPGSLVYTLDGAPWATLTSTNVPSTRMVLALQTQVWGCNVVDYTCPDSSTPVNSALDVDWVVAYARSKD